MFESIMYHWWLNWIMDQWWLNYELDRISLHGGELDHL